jgi:hydrogenase-4 component E
MIEILIVLFGLTLLWASITNMLGTVIKILVVQGIILFGITMLKTNHLNWLSFSLIALETLIFKAILIPWFINDTIRQNQTRREVEASVSNFFSLALMSLIFVLSFALAASAPVGSLKVFPLEFGIAFATILKGLFIIIANKKLITHLMGYLIMENGIFLLSLSAGSHLPYIVSLGVSLDILLSVLIAVLFIKRIRSTFDDADSPQSLREE